MRNETRCLFDPAQKRLRFNSLAQPIGAGVNPAPIASFVWLKPRCASYRFWLEPVPVVFELLPVERLLSDELPLVPEVPPVSESAPRIRLPAGCACSPDSPRWPDASLMAISTC